MQSKYDSFIESLASGLIGYFMALASQFFIFPALNIDVTLAENFLISVWFAAISMLRRYALRRWFNKRTLSLYKAASRNLLIDAEDVPAFLRRQAD